MEEKYSGEDDAKNLILTPCLVKKNEKYIPEQEIIANIALDVHSIHLFVLAN